MSQRKSKFFAITVFGSARTTLIASVAELNRIQAVAKKLSHLGATSQGPPFPEYLPISFEPKVLRFQGSGESFCLKTRQLSTASRNDVRLIEGLVESRAFWRKIQKLIDDKATDRDPPQIRLSKRDLHSSVWSQAEADAVWK